MIYVFLRRVGNGTTLLFYRERSVIDFGITNLVAVEWKYI